MSVWKVVRVFAVRLESFTEEHGWCSNFDILDVVAESAHGATHAAEKIAETKYSEAEYPEMRVRPEEVTILSSEVHCPVES